MSLTLYVVLLPVLLCREREWVTCNKLIYVVAPGGSEQSTVTLIAMMREEIWFFFIWICFPDHISIKMVDDGWWDYAKSVRISSVNGTYTYILTCSRHTIHMRTFVYHFDRKYVNVSKYFTVHGNSSSALLVNRQSHLDAVRTSLR